MTTARSRPRAGAAVAVTLIGALVGLVTALAHPAAAASPCEERAESAGNSLVIGMTCSESTPPTLPGLASVDAGEPQFDEYKWNSVCVPFNASASPADQPECSAALICPEPSERLWDLWGHEVGGSWVPIMSQCFGEPPTADAPQPQVTPALVLNEIRRIGLPTLQARTQPEGKTLVNFDTIFYTEAQPFSATVTLLGQQVDIVAEAVEYTWHHGDGQATDTTSPGAPYPSREIVYRYADADITVRPRVDVTYSARFRVNGGPWRDIPETLTVTGPEGSLRVSEARAVLSGDHG